MSFDQTHFLSEIIEYRIVLVYAVNHWTVTVDQCAISHSRWSLFLVDGLSICLPQDRVFLIQSQNTLCISKAHIFVNSAKQMKQRSLLSPLVLWEHSIYSRLCVGVDISPTPSNLSCSHAHTHFFLLFSCQWWLLCPPEKLRESPEIESNV